MKFGVVRACRKNLGPTLHSQFHYQKLTTTNLFFPRLHFTIKQPAKMVVPNYSKTYKVPRRPFESARLYV
jgi:hypothetical protein